MHMLRSDEVRERERLAREGPNRAEEEEAYLLFGMLLKSASCS